MLEVVVGSAAGDRAGFGEPVPGEDALERQLFADAPDELDRDVGRARDRDAQARDVAVRAIGMVEQRVVDRRRAREHRDALAFDEGEHDTRVEHGEREDRRARMRHARQPAL